MKNHTRTAPLSAEAYKQLAAFRSALRRFLAFSDGITGAAGVTAQQYQALLVIKASLTGEVMVKEIAEQMLLLQHGAVQLVDRLSQTRLIERRPSPTDGRSVLVALTARGNALIEHLAADHIRELLAHETLLAESLRRLRKMQGQDPTDLT